MSSKVRLGPALQKKRQ